MTAVIGPAMTNSAGMAMTKVIGLSVTNSAGTAMTTAGGLGSPRRNRRIGQD
jgi:hypothetical protein